MFGKVSSYMCINWDKNRVNKRTDKKSQEAGKVIVSMASHDRREFDKYLKFLTYKVMPINRTYEAG